jgi:HTH-type transcriptional regulator, glycine betaine synthesis regulator
VNAVADNADTHETRREVEDRFIEVWGDIAALWGVNKSVGRVQALLYLSPEPLDIEAIGERLQISHGNCSTSVRDLLAWGVIRRVHKPGDRRTYFEAEQDPWTWFHTTIRERRRREVVPVMERLHAAAGFAEGAAKAARGPERKQLEQLQGRIERFALFNHEFVELIDAFLAVGHGRLAKVLRTAARLVPRRRE